MNDYSNQADADGVMPRDALIVPEPEDVSPEPASGTDSAPVEPSERPAALGQAAPRYRLLTGMSTKVRPDPACPDELRFEAGEEHAATDFPEHVDLAYQVAAGYLEVV